MSMDSKHTKGELEKRYKNFNPHYHFTVTSQWVAQNGDLSPRALGVYLYLASNNHNFKFSENALYHHFKKAGLWTIKQAVKELENNHLIKRIRPKQDKHGKWTRGSKWVLYYVPDDIANKCDSSHANSHLSYRRIPSVRISSVRKPSTTKYQLKQVSNKTNINQQQLAKARLVDRDNSKNNRSNSIMNANQSVGNIYKSLITTYPNEHYENSRAEIYHLIRCWLKNHTYKEIIKVIHNVDSDKSLHDQKVLHIRPLSCIKDLLRIPSLDKATHATNGIEASYGDNPKDISTYMKLGQSKKNICKMLTDNFDIGLHTALLNTFKLSSYGSLIARKAIIEAVNDSKTNVAVKTKPYLVLYHYAEHIRSNS